LLQIIIRKFVCYFIGNMKRRLLNILIIPVILVFQLSSGNLYGRGFYPIPVIYSGNPHPVHISYTNIEYNQEKKKFEIIFKFYVDDFDLVLKAKYGKDLALKAGKWDNSYVNIIGKYILEHFKLIIDGKDKTSSRMKFVQKEVSETEIWLFYDYNAKEKNNIFEVHNSFLTDLYYDQHNLLIFTYLDQQKAVKLGYVERKETFSF
jgi:hypothetical protein